MPRQTTAAVTHVGFGSADAVAKVPVKGSFDLGTTTVQVTWRRNLVRGTGRKPAPDVGEPIDIYANNRRIARREVVVVAIRLGVTITEILDGGADRDRGNGS